MLKALYDTEYKCEWINMINYLQLLLLTQRFPFTTTFKLNNKYNGFHAWIRVSFMQAIDNTIFDKTDLMFSFI